MRRSPSLLAAGGALLALAAVRVRGGRPLLPLDRARLHRRRPDELSAQARQGAAAPDLFPNDVDWFKVTLRAGVIYGLDLRNIGYPFNLLALEVVDAAGRVLRAGENVDSDLRRIDAFRPDRSGTYYVRVSNEGAGDGYVGSYSVLVRQL